MEGTEASSNALQTLSNITNVSEESSEALVFTSTPKPKSRQKLFYSDDSLSEGEELLQVIVAQPKDTDSGSGSSSEVSGEFIDSIFVKKQKVTHSSCVEPEGYGATGDSDSESEVEGEFSINSKKNIEDVYTDTQSEAESDNETKEVSEEVSSKPRGKHRSRVLVPSQVLRQKCCSQECLKKLSLEQLNKARDNFCKEHPTYELQRKMILNWFDNNQPEIGKFVYTISGISVCWSAWTMTLGITRRTFYNLKADYLKGRRSEMHGSYGSIPHSEETDKTVHFLTKYFEESCDYLPNTSSWHLSSSTKKTDVYNDMCRAMSSRGMSVCSYATFRHVWANEFPHVKIPKENRFGKCDTCSNVNEIIRREGFENSAVQTRKSNHRIFVRNERSSYLNRSSAAHLHPNRFFSVAIDGMDQNKTELPFTIWRHSSLDKAWRLKVHIVGAVVHGRHPIVFLDYQQHPHDSNMTCNILLQVLWIHKNRLPSTLYIQLDNTCKENKNMHVFAFIAYLVEIKVFDKIEVCFLPVGHTHIDVDQMFSRLSVAIARRGAKTFQDLTKLIRECYSQQQGVVNQQGARPQYAKIAHMYAIREWLQPYAEEMHYLRDKHHCAFVRNEHGHCIIKQKPWCASTPHWDDTQWPPLHVFQKGLPEGVPDLVKPSFDEVGFGRLQSMVSSCTSKGILRSDEKELWEDFLEKERAYEQSYDDVEEIEYHDKYHKDVLAYMKCFDDQWPIDELVTRQKPNEDEEPQLDQVLAESEAYEKGLGILPAYTGRYRPQKQSQTRVIENECVQGVKVGMLVALDMEEHKERPLIAEVKEISEENVVIVWYSGSWTGKWTPAKRKQGRQWVEWIDEVSKEHIILFDFTLTGSGKLRSHSVRHLKQHYGMS